MEGSSILWAGITLALVILVQLLVSRLIVWTDTMKDLMVALDTSNNQIHAQIAALEIAVDEFNNFADAVVDDYSAEYDYCMESALECMMATIRLIYMRLPRGITDHIDPDKATVIDTCGFHSIPDIGGISERLSDVVEELHFVAGCSQSGKIWTQRSLKAMREAIEEWRT